MMKELKSILVCVPLVCWAAILYSQNLLLNTSDSIYRYEAFLDDPIAIDRINLLNIDFPCVEVL
ncbi:MAG: hypothetical protein HKN09_11160, partial [Saprospiraceae bacterium]|nr:hypothetical protein [Saprospiraceae bacterium]